MSHSHDASVAADSPVHVRIGVANLTRQAMMGVDITGIANGLIEEATRNPDNAGALMDLAIVAQLGGNQEAGLKIQNDALEIGRLFRIPSQVASPRLRVLAIAAASDIGGNTPIDFLLHGSDIELYMLYVVPGLPLPQPIPPHDVAVVVASPDKATAALEEIERMVQQWPCKVLNPPQNIARQDRDRLFHVLQGIDGLRIPSTARVTRQQLIDFAATGANLGALLPDGAFPLIVRPTESHAGRGLHKLDQPSDLVAYLEGRDEQHFFLSSYLHYASADGMFRKYRIVLIDGRPFACHMAISDQWKIWYLNAEMAESADKRAEEAVWMDSFDDGFAKRHEHALAQLASKLGLEYVAIDCAELPDGRLLVFETDNCSIVHDMDSPEIFPYKVPAMRKLFDAFVAMIGTYSARVATRAA
ncbi:ATP-grasp domain-containing protein [Roseiterribacter gracilis]|uniref:ATP-grasp domain-containing protein n=1 Tax=Roseiterribacter gracilis TaxID=2812848 RepID=A0A8S8X7Y9_9PROT|nr:hypothetical protein TMPK1_02090 [Rhodospirillales bacterium TMPK1]